MKRGVIIGIVMILVIVLLGLAINAILTIKSTQTTDSGSDMTFITCTPDTRDSDVCAQVYNPVCANLTVECIRAPCNPIKETYANSCEACQNERVTGYTIGVC